MSWECLDHFLLSLTQGTSVCSEPKPQQYSSVLCNQCQVIWKTPFLVSRHSHGQLHHQEVHSKFLIRISACLMMKLTMWMLAKQKWVYWRKYQRFPFAIWTILLAATERLVKYSHNRIISNPLPVCLQGANSSATEGVEVPAGLHFTDDVQPVSVMMPVIILQVHKVSAHIGWVVFLRVVWESRGVTNWEENLFVVWYWSSNLETEGL